MPPRSVVLCADDYGLSPGVGRGIRELLEEDRLSATSCMVIYPEFETEGPLLRHWLDRVDIGLHFTLTADRSANSLMRAAYLRRLDKAAVAAELERQLATFVRVMGRNPDYVDGHQHVHLLPGVREAVVGTAKRIGAYVRSTQEPIGREMVARASSVEAAFLSWTSGPLQSLIGRENLVTNRGFRGVRTFRETVPYRALFQRMIAGAADGCLVMCHPGHVDDVLASRDGVLDPREDEWKYFASEDFPRDISAAGLQLSRLAPALDRA
jgi:predicted glycoside hydrolase/deacetylase ChbG (UPF0249 family)